MMVGKRLRANSLMASCDTHARYCVSRPNGRVIKSPTLTEDPFLDREVLRQMSHRDPAPACEGVGGKRLTVKQRCDESMASWKQLRTWVPGGSLSVMTGCKQLNGSFGVGPGQWWEDGPPWFGFPRSCIRDRDHGRFTDATTTSRQRSLLPRSRRNRAARAFQRKTLSSPCGDHDPGK